MYCSLLWLTLHVRAGINISHLSILGILAYYRCYISHCFVFLNCLYLVLVFFKCLINLTSFLFKSKFISLPICDSAPLLSQYYYCRFYYFLLLICIYIYIYSFFSTYFVLLLFLIFIVN